MLRLNSSGLRSPLGLEAEPVPCVQCDRRERGLSWGDFCSICREERRLRANRLGRRWALGAAVVLAGWLFWATPPTPMSRFFGAASVLLIYVIVLRFVSRLLIEFMPKELKR
ncbi:MAG: hypothetical protein AB7L66_04715 [Gemmatimonadales bacterium]